MVNVLKKISKVNYRLSKTWFQTIRRHKEVSEYGKFGDLMEFQFAKQMVAWSR